MTRYIDADKVKFLQIPIAPVLIGEEVHMEEGVLKDWLDSMPTEDVRPVVRGRWIGHREHCENLGVMPSGLGAYEWCSKCDCGIDVREWHKNNYNYCPNCGADMREEKYETDFRMDN